jgi:hypothetical protein
MNAESAKPDYALPRQTNYETALGLGRERLSRLDFAEQCRRAAAEIAADSALIPFIDRRYRLDRATLAVTPADGGALPEAWEEIILLHYLAAATGAAPSGELITYRQIPDGAPYYGPFNRRTVAILLAAFDRRLPELPAAAVRLGGREVPGHGDFAFAIRALPRVEYLFAGWFGDDEFPPELRVLFDRGIVAYLPAEDITVLGQMICLKLVRLGRAPAPDLPRRP